MRVAKGILWVSKATGLKNKILYKTMFQVDRFILKPFGFDNHSIDRLKSSCKSANRCRLFQFW